MTRIERVAFVCGLLAILDLLAIRVVGHHRLAGWEVACGIVVAASLAVISLNSR